MSERRTSMDPRHIEYDALALAMFTVVFVAVAGVVALIVGDAAQRMDAGIIAAASLIGAGVTGAWIFGYPRHAAIPAIAFVLIAAIVFLPMVFDMNGAVLREAAGSGTPASRLYIAMSLYIGGLERVHACIRACARVRLFRNAVTSNEMRLPAARIAPRLWKDP